MTSQTEDFFEGKRPWSVIKDDVLGEYMPIYLSKVKDLQRPIIIVDGFAGPGMFEDGSVGSPIIICKSAEEYVKGKYNAFFINKKKSHHEKLKNVLEEANWLGSATALLGDTTKILPLLPGVIRNYTIFLYLDPFGPTGSPFALLEPFLERGISNSTEIVLMMHMPIVHRLAARNAVQVGRKDESKIKRFHATMSEVFGGDYWKPIMFSEGMSPEEREFLLIDAYKSKLTQYLPFVGSCPVRASARERIKYFIVFASRHGDAMLKMNDAMAKAYSKYMHRSAVAGTLFERTTWESERYIVGLEEEIISQVTENPGLTRKELWLKVVKNNFMLYLEKEYTRTIQQLVEQGVLESPTPRKTKRLNSYCRLFLSKK